MFGTLGVPEIAVIFILALVLFGPKKLPELGRTIGKAMTEFRRASNDLKATFEREMNTLERESQEIHTTTRQTAREIADHASYDMVPSPTMWNPLEEAITETSKELESAMQDTPAAVSASEVSGAESTGTEVAAAPVPEPVPAAPEHVGIEGTVPRGSVAASASMEELVQEAAESGTEKPVNG
jgi:sec-independent protein translocase protein TatA